MRNDSENVQPTPTLNDTALERHSQGPMSVSVAEKKPTVRISTLESTQDDNSLDSDAHGEQQLREAHSMSMVIRRSLEMHKRL